jgi:Protein of unknown function (DUF4058)
MPLLDHFHPPLSQRRHWESFHSAWASALADALNEEWLPDGYFAEEMITVGGRVEIDVATFDELEPSPPTPLPGGEGRNGGSVAVARKTWAPPTPSATMPAVFPDSFAVKVFGSEGGPKLVGSIELVSPSNKDREATRQAFAIKCASYLHQGVGLVIVDIVTSRQANLHNAIIRLLGQADSFLMSDAAPLYGVAYRPVTRVSKAEIDLWQQPLALGNVLPTLPLALSVLDLVPLDLESTYEDVCRRRL